MRLLLIMPTLDCNPLLLFFSDKAIVQGPKTPWPNTDKHKHRLQD